MEQDTIKLLRECDSGVKMGVDSINDVLQSTRSPELKKLLTDCRNQHEILGDEISRKLCAACEPGKQTPACEKGLAWIKTNVKLAVNESDSTVADLITDGCNMGVKSLHRYLNRYSNADADSKGLAHRLIGLEDALAKELRTYL